ncbi:VIT family-domain-containing protein [Cercophora samala]|uniref:VIT family-domain-containing protein n=1 Tax=Cercophora samala TaxID=330535 RepID=A0AA39ZL34_9PEZI|nr:VIT family-domain-containing protein [Cercophora samala]
MMPVSIRFLRKSRDSTPVLPTSTKQSTPPPSLDNGISPDVELHPSASNILDHPQQHSTIHKPLVNPRLISDATIGLSDGLTVPFALTAGLTALGDTRTVIYAGLAELIAGAISMGLGGYLGAKGELAAYEESRARLVTLLRAPPPPGRPTNDANTTTTTTGQDTVIEALQHGLSPLTVSKEVLGRQVVNGDVEGWVGLLLRLQGVSLPMTTATSSSSSSSSAAAVAAEEQTALDDNTGGDKKRRGGRTRRGSGNNRTRAMKSAVTIAAGYFLGGLLPLIPYFFLVAGHPGRLMTGLYISIGIMGVALFTFGYVKTGVVVGFGRQQGGKCTWGGVQMVVVGGMAAGAAMGLVKGFEGVGTFGS